MEISIPTHQRAATEGGTFTVFRVQTVHAGVTSVVLRRYTEFEALHRVLRQEQVVVPLELPPKKMLKFHSKVLEQRQLGLERYLRALSSLYPPPAALHRFLEVASFLAPAAPEAWPEPALSQRSHQPVLSVATDAWITERTGTLPDTIAQALKLAFYS